MGLEGRDDHVSDVFIPHLHRGQCCLLPVFVPPG